MGGGNRFTNANQFDYIQFKNWNMFELLGYFGA